MVSDTRRHDSACQSSSIRYSRIASSHQQQQSPRAGGREGVAGAAHRTLGRVELDQLEDAVGLVVVGPVWAGEILLAAQRVPAAGRRWQAAERASSHGQQQPRPKRGHIRRAAQRGEERRSKQMYEAPGHGWQRHAQPTRSCFKLQGPSR